MFREAAEQINGLPRAVQIWMRWLNICFLLGLVFVADHEGARWALIAYAVSFPAAIPIFYHTRRISLTGLAHILFWTPLLVYLPISVAAEPGFDAFTPYGVWLALTWLTIAICVLLDLRALLIAPDPKPTDRRGATAAGGDGDASTSGPNHR